MTTILGEYHVGQPVIYRSRKHDRYVGSHAREAQSMEHGEVSQGEVDKFSTVDNVDSAGTLVLRTRRGETHIVQANDPGLRPATSLERFWYRKKFPQPMVP